MKFASDKLESVNKEVGLVVTMALEEGHSEIKIKLEASDDEILRIIGQSSDF